MEMKDAKVVELDVREQLRNKLEPFQLIMDTVKTLEKDNIFLLHATFKPTPLLGLLKMKGLVGKSEKIGNEHWLTTFVNKKNKSWLDHEQVLSTSRDFYLESIENDFQTTAKETVVEETTSKQREARIITLDNRGLEPPKPMMRTLAAIERSQIGDEVHIHNDRVPVFLIEEITNLGCDYVVDEQADGSAKVVIRKR